MLDTWCMFNIAWDDFWLIIWKDWCLWSANYTTIAQNKRYTSSDVNSMNCLLAIKCIFMTWWYWDLRLVSFSDMCMNMELLGESAVRNKTGVLFSGVYSTFIFGMSVQSWRAENKGLENRLPPNLGSWRTEFFVQFEALGTEIWSNLRLKNCNFPRFEKRNFQKFVNLGKCRTLRNWKIINWGLKEQPGGLEKGVLRAAHTRIPFSGEYPARGLFIHTSSFL